jgi:large subunit ribosomal protein L7Ae
MAEKEKIKKEKKEEKPKVEKPEETEAEAETTEKAETTAPEKKVKPEDLVEKVYDIVEIARSTGKIKKGTNEVTKSVERSEPKLVVATEDCDPPEILMHLPALCNERDIPFVKVPSKKELGSVSGLEVPCVAIAVVDGGEAKDLLLQVRRQIKGK